MPDFNQSPPDSRDPNLPNIHPIENIAGNQAGKTLFDTLGSGISEFTNVVDTAIKKSIQDKSYAGVDPARDQFTAGLQQIKKQLDTDNTATPAPVQNIAGATTGKSLLDANAMADEDDLPPGLESGVDRIKQLAAAKAAGSIKLNDTQYAMETLSVAKNLRAQYGTGYREYIDSEVSKASGLPVANSYYQNLMQDINRQMNQQGKTKDDLKTMMEKNPDVPMMGAYYEKYNSGDPTITQTMIFKKIADYRNLQAQQTIDAASRKESDDNTVTKQRTETVNLTRDANRTVDSFMKDTVNLSGMPGLGSIMTYFQEVQAGSHPEATDQDIKQRVYQLQAYRQGIYQQLKQRSADSDTVFQDGGETSEKILKHALEPLDNYIKLANDKDASPAFFHQHMVDALSFDDRYSALTSKDRGPLSRQIMTARSIYGEQYFPDWIRSIVANGLDDPIKNSFSQMALNSLTPMTDNRGQPLPQPIMKTDIQGAKERDIPADSGIHGKIVGLVNTIADPKASNDAKDAVINYAFDPKNIGRLDEFRKDYKDPVTGKIVPGKYGAFNILSSPKVTAGVVSASKDKPENYQKYEGTLQTEFAELYRSDVKTLNGVLETPYVGVHFSFNSDKNSYGLVDNQNRPIERGAGGTITNLPVKGATASERSFASGDSQRYVGTILDALDRVNGGLSNLANVHKQNPAGEVDTPKYLLQVLQTTAGGRFGYNDLQSIGGATEGMMKAVIKSQAPELTPQELHDRVMQYTQGGNQGPTVAQFVSNPNNDPLPKSPRGLRGNLSDETLLGIKTDEIPAGMSARDFIQQLKKEGRY